jgi:hypothetical protein
VLAANGWYADLWFFSQRIPKRRKEINFAEKYSGVERDRSISKKYYVWFPVLLILSTHQNEIIRVAIFKVKVNYAKY